MNLNREEIKKEVEKIKQQEAVLAGVKIELDEDDIIEGRQDAMWYGGVIGSITYKHYRIEIIATGDVRAVLYLDKKEIASIKDKGNCGRFYDEMREYIADDNSLYELLKYEYITNAAISEYGNVLFVDDHNWLEYVIEDVKENDWSEGGIIEGNDVLDAFAGVEEYIKIITDYEAKKTRTEERGGDEMDSEKDIIPLNGEMFDRMRVIEMREKQKKA